MAKTISPEEHDEVLEELRIAERELRAKEHIIQEFAKAQVDGAAPDSDAELKREKSRADKAEAELKALRLKAEKAEAERIQNEADEKAKADAKAAEILANTHIEQSEHSRYRVMNRVPSGERDLFGDPTTEVFDTGVYFTGFYGGIYLPVAMVIEMAQSIGMLTTEESKALADHSIESDRRAEKAPKLAKELQSGIDRLIHKFNAAIDDAGVDSLLDSESEPETITVVDSNAGQINDISKGSDGRAISASPADSKLDIGKNSK